MKFLEDSTITKVPYFKACGIHVGLRKKERKDLCVIYSEKKAVAAAAFTQNKVKAAPVMVNMKHINSGNTQAIVINSGYANSCTGNKGIEDAYLMAEFTGKKLGLQKEEVLVASTGRIGNPLPMDILIPGIEKACDLLSYEGGKEASEAILTTDTFTKNFGVEITIDNKKVYICGMAKGSGMVHPNMGTILGFITTNVNISKRMLTKILKENVEDTYNMISVDGDTSTNDMVIVMANGGAKNVFIDEENESYLKFKKALGLVNEELSKMIAKDGEGASKLIEITVKDARTKKDAKLCAKSVISSNLVKSAFFGSDSNWGRIMSSIGYSKGHFEPHKVDIMFKNKVGSLQVVKNSTGIPLEREKVKKILDENYINVIIDLNDGVFDAVAWGCDLTYDYVKINGHYRV